MFPKRSFQSSLCIYWKDEVGANVGPVAMFFRCAGPSSRHSGIIVRPRRRFSFYYKQQILVPTNNGWAALLLAAFRRKLAPACGEGQ
jgi:hypothetical protein